jgi:hypothetical protein
VEGEDVSARRLGVERVREARLGAGGLVGEGKGPLESRRNLVGEPVDVLGGLPSDSCERLALLLRFQDADGPAVDEEEVVGSAVRLGKYELAHGDAAGSGEVGLAGVLDRPAGSLEHPVDLDPGLGLRRQVAHGHRVQPPVLVRSAATVVLIGHCPMSAARTAPRVGAAPPTT